MRRGFPMLAVMATVFGLALAASLGVVVPPAVATGSYTITEIPTLGGTESWAKAINSSGQVTGYARIASGPPRAFVWAQGSGIIGLGTLGGSGSFGSDINDAGQVVGSADLWTEVGHAFLWAPGGPMVDLGTLAGSGSYVRSYAYAIDNNGEVVGSSDSTGGSFHAFRKPPSSAMEDLGTLPGGHTSAAYAINDAGQVAGGDADSGTSGGYRHAVLWSGGTITDLGTLPGGVASNASAINTAGQVVGWSNTGPSSVSYPVIWYNGSVTALSGVLWGYGRGINSRGDVVGAAGFSGSAQYSRAFLWSNGTMTNLNTLLPAGSGWVLEHAWDINDAGQIVGDGLFNGQRRGFLLTPTSSSTAPTVSAVSPASGPAAGDTNVTISGTNFADGAAVAFGGVAATGVTVVNGGVITAVTPAHAAGTADVVVTNSDGQSGTLAGGFTFVAPPTASSVSPGSGPTAGGTSVTISGTGFQTDATVSLGGTAATGVTVPNNATILATTPPQVAGVVDIVVRNPDGQSSTLAGGFTYFQPPTINTVKPASGPTTGRSVTINGSGFQPGAAVSFGGVSAASVVVASSGKITADAPPHAAGMVDVTVSNPDGGSATLVNGFTYRANRGKK